MTQQTIRRVVTGFDACGQSIVLSDEELLSSTEKWGPGMPHWPLIWGTDAVPAVIPLEGTPDCKPSDWPDLGGVRVRILDRTEGYGVPAQGVPDAIKDLDPASAMHRTDTVDIVIILSGEVGIEHGDGTESILRAGDMLIIQGTRHTWKPRGSCRIAAVVVGARPPATLE